VTFAGVGDSVTNGDSVDFAGGNSGSLSWATYASSDARKFVGGFASGGAESDEMLARAVPVAADVLVVMAGTNDSGHSVPYDVINSNILGVVQGMNIDHVVICAIPPRDSDTEISSGFNAQLQEFVVAQGWTWVDPWAPSRDPETGAWLPGLTSDGIHPVQTAAETAGGLIGEAITAAVPAN
jgi:lysophospholipase L1-like esterase